METVISFHTDYDVIYVLVLKTLIHITDDVKTVELMRSNNVMDCLEELMNHLRIRTRWGEKIEMTDGKSFLTENPECTVIYSIETICIPQIVNF